MHAYLQPQKPEQRATSCGSATMMLEMTMLFFFRDAVIKL